jgi:RecB family exonuclease
MNMRDEGVHATDAGKRTHALLEAAKDSEPAQIEPWVTVQLTDEGEERIVIYDITKMARLLWQHNPKDEVIGFEVEFVKTLHGIPFKGVIDRLSVDYILDYKTTGGSLQYAKTPFKLKKDVQRLIYHAVHPTKYALWVTGTWANSAGALRANAKLEGAVVPYTTLASQLTRDEKRDAENFKTYVLTVLIRSRLRSPRMRLVLTTRRVKSSRPMAVPITTRATRASHYEQHCNQRLNQ